jgi:NAD(P)H-hydrate epimerase
MGQVISETELAELLHETGQRHHAAFAESEGADPEWALWYATDLQARLWDRAGRLPSRGELCFLLVGAEREHGASGGEEPWPRAYARFILAGLASAPGG